jgi:hypothetical protein
MAMFSVPTTIDMAGFLKLFQQDGNPAASKLSPVRKRVNKCACLIS